MRYLITIIFSLNIAFNIIKCQTYCLTFMAPSDNGTTVSYPWSLTVSNQADASIRLIGTGDLSGSNRTIGGTGSGPHSGTAVFTKSASSGIYGFNINTNEPFGVIGSSSPFVGVPFMAFCAVAPINYPPSLPQNIQTDLPGSAGLLRLKSTPSTSVSSVAVTVIPGRL